MRWVVLMAMSVLISCSGEGDASSDLAGTYYGPNGYVNVYRDGRREAGKYPEKPFPTLEEKEEAKKSQQRLRERIDDARAMLKEAWISKMITIAAIEAGYKCNVLGKTETNLAILKIQLEMDRQKINAGLISDNTLDILALTEAPTKTGDEAAANGACDRMSQADRGRLRTLVSALSAL